MERTEFIAGLREVADFYESTPDAELPYGEVAISYFFAGDVAKEQLARWARLLSKAEKDVLGEGPEAWFIVKRNFGGVVIEANALRKSVCTKRVVRVEQVPEIVVPEQIIPARNVEVVEWDCPSLLENAGVTA